MTNSPSRLGDRVLLDVFANRFQALSEEMAYVIQRTGFTVYVKESLDYMASLIEPNGETVSFSQRLGTAVMLRSTRETLDAAGPYEPGDVIITNDPVSSGGLSTHLPDVYLWKPVFWKDKITCYLCCFIHVTDVGGRVAGSVSPSSSEIFQEGLRLPPSRLYRGGELNRDVLNIYLHNSRIPEPNWGDLKALLAAMNTAEARIHAMMRRYGPDTIHGAMGDVLDYAEESARATIRTIPDGSYCFVDYCDSDLISTRPIRIELEMVVKNDEIVLDFTGTDYEVQTAFNIPLYGKMHMFIGYPFVTYMRATKPSCPLNGGILRPLELIAEPGSILHPGPNAPVGVRMATVFRVQDAIFGTLAQATEGVVPAAPAGQGAIPLVSLPNPRTGGTRVSQIQPMLGGSGARPNKDGIDGRGLSVASGLKNVPAERLEVDMPVVMRAFGLVPDSGAPGRFRGGTAVKVAFETLSHDTIVTARGMERFRFRPWGLYGGYAGSLGETILQRDSREPEQIGRIDILTLDAGDTIYFASPSGGGYGSPLERPLEAVEWDVRQGLVSPDGAFESYGVVMVDGRVDRAATDARRAALAHEGVRPEFDFGPERAEYEARWPEATQREFRSVLSALSAPLRPYVCRLLYSRIEREHQDGRPISAENVRAVWEEVRGQLNARGRVS